MYLWYCSQPLGPELTETERVPFYHLVCCKDIVNTDNHLVAHFVRLVASWIKKVVLCLLWQVSVKTSISIFRSFATHLPHTCFTILLSMTSVSMLTPSFLASPIVPNLQITHFLYNLKPLPLLQHSTMKTTSFVHCEKLKQLEKAFNKLPPVYLPIYLHLYPDDLPFFLLLQMN